MSDEHIYWTVKGKEHLHERAILDEFKGLPNKVELLKQKHGEENVYQKNRTRKNRYIFFRCNKVFKKELLKNLKQIVQPYPKGDNQRYDASYKPTIQTSLF